MYDSIEGTKKENLTSCGGILFCLWRKNGFHLHNCCKHAGKNQKLTAAQPDLVKVMFIIFCGFEALGWVMWC